MQVEYVDGKVPNLQYRDGHEVATSALTSTVPGGEEPKFFYDRDPEKVMRDVYHHMMQLSQKNYECEKIKFREEFKRLEELQQQVETTIQNAPNGSDKRREKRTLGQLKQLHNRLDRHCRQLTVLTYNGGRYDLNLVKKYLFPQMVREAREARGKEALPGRPILKGANPWPNAINRSSTIMCLMTNELRFVDVILYVAPGTSLDKFIKAFNPKGQQKGIFPYELVGSSEELERVRECPSKSAFYSTLKNRHITDQEYEEVRWDWEALPEKSLLEFAKQYNLKDVVPFLDACSNMVKLYWDDFKVDIFKEAISIPGVCLAYLFKQLHRQKPATSFGLFNEEQGELCQELYGKKSLCDGLSFIGQRVAIKDQTPIRGNTEKKVKKVVGYDFNAFYLHSLMQEMQTGDADWWVIQNGNFELNSKTLQDKLKERHSHGEVEVLKFHAWLDQVYIHTAEHGEQASLGIHAYRVDGFAKDAQPKPRVYNYNGCYWHGHQQGCLKPPKSSRPDVDEQRRKDVEQMKGLREMGFEVVTIWEYYWNAVKDLVRKIERGQSVQPSTPFYYKATKYLEYLKEHPPRIFRERKVVKEGEMREAILNGQLFGFVKVDISTPDELKERFEVFPPIIKHTEISLDDVGEYMKEITVKHCALKKPTDALIGSYSGEKVWLMTPLLQFYHSHGLIIEHIYKVVQFDKEKTFKWFGETVTEHRKQGDQDKDKAILAEVYKLLGNSAYGKTITNLVKHRNTCFTDQQEANECHNYPYHSKSIKISEDCYEVQYRKERVNFNLPMVIGLAVYSYAKLRMLRFIYEVLLVFLDKSDYMLFGV